MESKLKLTLITPEKNLFEDDAVSVSLPVLDGLRGVLPGHVSQISVLGPGEIQYRKDDNSDWTKSYLIEGGFAKINAGEVLILADKAYLPEDLDKAEIEKELQEQSELLTEGDRAAAQRQKKLDLCRAKLAYLSKSQKN